ncbi:MAG TPA: efflux RND transporter periplasmic adaptor subunit, partial [Thermoanaerobacterales bacterium]|nr:efflux RND transporter periplasmic adaptor subunit [Thermoanaerobacterales bacterium]
DLYEEGAVSKQQFDGVKLQYTLAKTQYESAQISVPGNLNAAEAQLKQAQAGLELARSQLENSIIKSPATGVVSLRDIDEGDMAAPGNPVFTIVNLDEVHIDLNISEKNIGNLEKGQEVSVIVSATNKSEFIGSITNVSPSADPRTRSFPVRVEIDNSKHILKGGMFAQVLIKTQKIEDALLVPQEAVIDMGTEKVVYVIEDDIAYKRSVVTGINDGENIEIISGIKNGDNIVIVGQNLLRDKTKVSVADRGDK